MTRGGSAPRERISAAQGRRIALAAQGFAERWPAGGGGHAVRRLFDRVGLVQIDSVNVLSRAHYLPLFARAGAYERAALDRCAHYAPRRLFEYWGHEASLIPVGLHPALRWRMERGDAWRGIQRIARERPDLVERVRAEVAARGPVAAREIEAERPVRTGPWWDWSEVKRALEWLFFTGQITSARRGSGFERRYDLTERVLPRAALAAPTPTVEEAQRTLIGVAARALGVATEPDLRDYFRLAPGESRPRVAELVEAGALTPVAVEGWSAPAYMDPAARVPRRVDARALVGPFDSLIWNRPRTERLFGFRYRIEIYVPAAKRVHGYYVLPFLYGDRLVARVDLKADRAAGVLRVQSAFTEPDGPDGGSEALHATLGELAAWLGLERVVTSGRAG